MHRNIHTHTHTHTCIDVYLSIYRRAGCAAMSRRRAPCAWAHSSCQSILHVAPAVQYTPLPISILYISLSIYLSSLII